MDMKSQCLHPHLCMSFTHVCRRLYLCVHVYTLAGMSTMQIFPSSSSVDKDTPDGPGSAT